MAHSTTESYEQDTQCTYKRSTEVLSRNCCCHGLSKVLHILSVCIALVIQDTNAHAPCYPYIVICGLSGCTRFFHIIS